MATVNYPDSEYSTDILDKLLKDNDVHIPRPDEVTVEINQDRFLQRAKQLVRCTTHYKPYSIQQLRIDHKRDDLSVPICNSHEVEALAALFRAKGWQLDVDTVTHREVNLATTQTFTLFPLLAPSML